MPAPSSTRVRPVRIPAALFGLCLLSVPPQRSVTSVSGAGGAPAGAQAPGARPATLPVNVLLIVLDDVGTDKLALYGETPPAGVAGCPVVPELPPPYPATPRLDALARRGILFDSFYVNGVCAPTRAALQTGRYSHQTGFVGLTTATGPCVEPDIDDCFKVPDSEVFLAELLRYGLPPEKAYRTGTFGKWHMTRPWNPTHAVDNGYQRFSGSIGNLRDHYRWTKIEHDEGREPVESEATGWSASVVRADAVAWINAQPEPFFAAVNFHPPHRPWQLPPLELLSEATACELAELELASGSTGEYLPGAVADSGDPEHKVQLFFRAMLESVDAEIGRLLDQIEPGKLLNTMVFVLSDNGTVEGAISTPPHDATHGKGTVYRLGTRVPMIAWGPKIPPAPPGGWRCGELVGAVDLWRTMAALSGADEERAFLKLGIVPAPPVASVSFVGLLQRPGSQGARAWAFVQDFVPSGLIPEGPSYIDCLVSHERAVTDGIFTYVRRQAPKETPCEPRTYLDDELYLRTDLNEAHNLFDPLTGLVVADAPEGAQAALEFLREVMFFESGD